MTCSRCRIVRRTFAVLGFDEPGRFKLARLGRLQAARVDAAFFRRPGTSGRPARLLAPRAAPGVQKCLRPAWRS